jgi:hypothetical protein
MRRGRLQVLLLGIIIRSLNEMARLRERFTAWIANELSTEAGLATELAARVSERILSGTKPTTAAVCDQEAGIPNWYVSAAASAVTCARATALCPGQKDWWRGPGRSVLELLLGGDATAAEIRQAEMLAGHYDFDFDTNWPEHKRFRVLDVPEHLPLGSLLIGSNEEGLRAEFEIVEREGVRGLQRTSTPARQPTADIWRQARKEAEVLAEQAG